MRPRAPLLAAALAIALGVLAGRWLPVPRGAVALLGLGAAVAALAFPRASMPAALLAIGSLAAARAGPVEAVPPHAGRFEACLARVSLSPDGHLWSAEGAVREVTSSARAWSASILLPASRAGPVPKAGDRVRLRGAVRPPRPPSNPGEADRTTEAVLDGRAGALRAREGWLVAGSCGGDALGPARAALAARIREELPPREAAIARALALGDASGLDPDDAESFRATGTLHLLSIAGVNLGILALLAGIAARELLLAAVPRWCRRHDRRTGIALAALAVAAAWALFAGGRLPAGRALIAMTLGAAAIPLGARRSGWNAFGAAIGALLLAFPGAIDAPGFQLGCSALAGILATASSGTPPADRLAARAIAWIVAMARMTAAAALATFPLLAWRYGSVPALGAAANLPALPLLGFGALVPLAASPPLALVSETAARLAVRAAHPALSLAPGLVAMFAGLPLARVRLFLGAPAAAAAALAVFGALLLTGRARAPVVGLGLALAIAATVIAGRPPPSMEVTFLAVGQGDATVVRLADGTTILVDGGPPGAGTRVVVPFLRAAGIRRVDVMVVSHAHPDHTGGLAAVADALPVGELWLAGPACGEPGLVALVERLVAARTPIYVVGRGTRARYGNAEIDVAGGTADAGPEPVQARGRRNDASLVLRISDPTLSVLLPGDVEREGERALLDGGAALASDVVKVPHHGSPTSSGPDLIAAVRPAIAVVPVGAENPFGFPNAAVVARWESAHAKLFRTDLDGAVTVARCPGNDSKTAICARSFVDGDSAVAVPYKR